MNGHVGILADLEKRVAQLEALHLAQPAPQPYAVPQPYDAIAKCAICDRWPTIRMGHRDAVFECTCSAIVVGMGNWNVQQTARRGLRAGSTAEGQE